MDQRISLVSAREQWASAIATAMIVAVLGIALVWGLGVRLPTRTGDALTMLDLRVPPPPARIPPPPVEHPMTRRAKHAPAPPNLRSRATPVVAPPLPLPPTPMVAAKVAGIGAAPTAGASDRAGPGIGAGGAGDGDGGGGDGEGGDTPPEQTKGRLRYADLPPELRQAGIEASLEVRYGVDIRGSVDTCAVSRSSGYAAIDATVCNLIRQRFRFRPSLDADGRPVHSIVIERHSFAIDRSGN